MKLMNLRSGELNKAYLQEKTGMAKMLPLDGVVVGVIGFFVSQILLMDIALSATVG